MMARGSVPFQEAAMMQSPVPEKRGEMEPKLATLLRRPTYKNEADKSWKYRAKVTFQDMCHPALFSTDSANSFDRSKYVGMTVVTSNKYSGFKYLQHSMK